MTDSINNTDDEDLVIQRVPIYVTPPDTDPKWIRDENGLIVGYENYQEMTLEEFKKIYE